jgi:hypothetical protein
MEDNSSFMKFQMLGVPPSATFHHLIETEAQCHAANHWTKVHSGVFNELRKCLHPKWIF